MRRTCLLLVVSLVGTGCAEGGAPSRRDGGMDSAVDDAPPLDDVGDLADVGEPDGGVPDTSIPSDAGAIACTPATATADCGARPCVDGFCCDGPCTGACRSCDLPGAEGVCTMHAAGSDADDECAAQAPGTCGTVGECDGSGACALHPASTSCDDGMACTTSDACDGAGTCRGAAPAECSPGAGNECCLGSCGAAGCRTDPGACADVCGASQLAVGRACMGCGAARAAGSCLGGSIHLCDATSHLLCQQVSCGGTAYTCTLAGGVWAWRTSSTCDDGNPCTHGDTCSGGTCGGTAITCTSTTCTARACNGTATCTTTPRTGTACDDGNPCSYNDACTAVDTCVGSSTITCADTPCLDRECNGTATCTETSRSGLSCDDGNACTYGEVCSVAGACGSGSTVVCPATTTCRTFVCNGTSACAPMAQNVGGTCDDGNPATSSDVCRADGTCAGFTCSPTLVSVFSDDFTAPSSTTWTNGTDVLVSTSRWRTFTNAGHGARVNGGRFEITNRRSSSGGHGHGYAYVRTGGVGSAYDNTRYLPTLAANAGQEVVWTFNMRRDDPESTDGGFRCSSSSLQNDVTVGLAYVLAASSASGLQADTGTCSTTASAVGYAVVMGGSGGRVRLVRFTGGLRNGALTDIAQSGTFDPDLYFSVRVTYNAVTNLWRLEARSDGSSNFANPAAGSYGAAATGTDATHVATSLEYSGPYFQTGCTGTCSSTYLARFDNVTVGLRCAP